MKTLEIKITLKCTDEYYHEITMGKAEGVRQLNEEILKNPEIEKCKVEVKSVK